MKENWRERERSRVAHNLTWSNLFIAVLAFLIISNGAPTSHKDRMTAKAIKDAFNADKYKKQK